ncbi:MAG: aldo/keto reductase, partial [Anaerolineaceae bacterium]
MEYRELGKTGLKVSTIGLGCEHLDGKPYSQIENTIGAALEHNINILDVFMPGKEIRENIAKALGDKRNKVIIQGHFGSTDLNRQYDISRDMPTVQRYFEDILRMFGGYIDLGMMFFIDSEEDYKNVFETDFAKYVEHMKKQGYIGHIGFSSHNPATAIKAINTGLPEMLMFSINPAFDMLPSDEYVFDHFDNGFDPELFRGIDPKRAELYKLCTQKQIGITVMKSLGAGKLLSPDHTPFAKPLNVYQCIHYALTRPAVASVLLGCQTSDEIQKAMQYFEIDDSQKDYAEILGSMRNDFKGNCVYCNHCQPCPTEIDIATVNKYLDIARLDTANIPPSIRSHYLSLSHNGSDCIECGNCEDRCPFDVPIIKNMA